MYDPNHDAPPFNPVPPVVWALVGVLALAEAAFQMGARGLIGGPAAVGWRQEAAQQLAFYGRFWDYLMQTGAWGTEAWRFVSYAAVHGGFTHTLFACVLLLALGNFTARIYHPVALVGVFAVSLVAGAVIFGLSGASGVLLGSYPGIYGLIGLYTWCLWTMSDKLGQNPYRAFQLIGLLVALQIAFSLMSGRWDYLAAEVAGFAAGFALAAPAAPGGLARLRHKLRGR